MLRIDHVVLPVGDAAASLAFYGEVLCLPLVSAHEGDDWGGRPWLMMIFALAEDHELVLVALRGARPKGHGLPADTRHYAFSVEDRSDQDRWRVRLAGAGVCFWEEDHGDQHSLYFTDPDGVVLEITTPPSRPGREADPAARARARAWIGERAAAVGH